MAIQGNTKVIYLVTDTSWWMKEGWRIATDVVNKIKDGRAFLPSPLG